MLAHKPLVLSNPAPYTLGVSLLKLFGNTPEFFRLFLRPLPSVALYGQARPKQNVTQVIAGNTGRKLNGGWSPEGGPYFGFTEVNIYDDNSVGVVSYTRPAPSPYNAPGPQPAAKPAKEIFFPLVGKAKVVKH